MQVLYFAWLRERIGTGARDDTTGGGSSVESPHDDDTDTDEPPGRFDLWLNTVPDQGSEVVRTEEAMFATLAALNLE